MARKVVPCFSVTASSGHGHGVAVFICLLWRGTVPERNPTMGYLIPRCSRSGNAEGGKSPRCFDLTIGGRIRRCEGHTSLKSGKTCGKLGNEFSFCQIGEIKNPPPLGKKKL